MWKQQAHYTCLGNTCSRQYISVYLSKLYYCFVCSVSEEDGGVYICEASNGYDPAAMQSATLTVLSEL